MGQAEAIGENRAIEAVTEPIADAVAPVAAAVTEVATISDGLFSFEAMVLAL